MCEKCRFLAVSSSFLIVIQNHDFTKWLKSCENATDIS